MSTREVPLEPDDEVESLIRSADVWDMTLPWLPLYWDMEILERYRKAGYTFISATLQDWPPTLGGMRDSIEQFRSIAVRQAPWLAFGSSLAEIDRGRREGKLVIGLNSQETCLIGEDLSRIEQLSRIGVRHMLLAYNVRNLVADGCAERANAGLSNFGRRVVQEMNRVGIIVDGTHTGRRSSLEAIELSQHPVIFSHSNPYAVCAHIRNLHDDQIQACARRGGVVGIVGVGAFLGDVDATAETMFRHIDYVVQLVGPTHVGLGTDYVKIFPVKDHVATWERIASSITAWPDPTDGWPDPTGTQLNIEDCYCFGPERLNSLVKIMLAHGYSNDSIRGILGANFRRVYESVESVRTVALADREDKDVRPTH